MCSTRSSVALHKGPRWLDTSTRGEKRVRKWKVVERERLDGRIPYDSQVMLLLPRMMRGNTSTSMLVTLDHMEEQRSENCTVRRSFRRNDAVGVPVLEDHSLSTCQEYGTYITETDPAVFPTTQSTLSTLGSRQDRKSTQLRI